MAGWSLVGVTAGRGACDHCGRSLARLFRVLSPEGAVLTVGRSCAAGLTGWSASWADAERAERRRVAELAARESYGDLYAALEAVQVSCGPAGLGLAALRGEYGWMGEVEAVEYAREMLAAAVGG